MRLSAVANIQQLLYALGARVSAQQTYDPQVHKLKISVDAVEGARIRIGVYTPFPVRRVTGTRTSQISFATTRITSLMTFEVVHVPGEVFELSFDQVVPCLSDQGVLVWGRTWVNVSEAMKSTQRNYQERASIFIPLG